MLKKVRQFKDRKDAEKWYNEKRTSIRRLAQQPDFAEFIEWWEREYDDADKRVDDLAGKDEVHLAIKERAVVRKFLQFIENLTTQ